MVREEMCVLGRAACFSYFFGIVPLTQEKFNTQLPCPKSWFVNHASFNESDTMNSSSAPIPPVSAAGGVGIA